MSIRDVNQEEKRDKCMTSHVLDYISQGSKHTHSCISCRERDFLKSLPWKSWKKHRKRMTRLKERLMKMKTSDVDDFGED